MPITHYLSSHFYNPLRKKKMGKSTYKTLILLCGLSLCLSSPAKAQIFKCKDAQGAITYSNIKAPKNQDCIRMEIETNVVPAKAAGNFKPRTKKTTNTKFPRVSQNQQNSRDQERFRLLERELANEQKNLDNIKQNLRQDSTLLSGSSDPALQANITQHERNIESLEQELSKLR